GEPAARPAASRQWPAPCGRPRYNAAPPARVGTRRSPQTVWLTPGRCADGAVAARLRAATDRLLPGRGCAGRRIPVRALYLTPRGTRRPGGARGPARVPPQ